MLKVLSGVIFRKIVCSCLFAAFGASIAAESSAAMSDSNWATLQRSATDDLDSNKYWLAEPLLKQSVSEAEKFGFDDLRLAKAYGELARYYRIRGRFQDAQPWYEREYAVKEVAFGSDPGKLVQPLGALIIFYLQYGTANKADPLTDDVISIVEGKMRDSREKAGQSSAVHLQKDAPLTGWAGKIAPSQATPLMEWAITCDSIANAYRARANYKTADKLYKEALDVKAAILGKGHLSLANSYDSLGSMCVEKGELKEAEGYFKDALATTENTLSSDSPEVYSRLDRLAKCLIKEKKYDEAEKLYLRALEFWKKEPSRNGDESRAYFALGCFYSDLKKFGPAAAMLSEALDRVAKFSGPCSVGLVPYLRKLAYVDYYIGRRGESEALKSRALAINGEPFEPPPVVAAADPPADPPATTGQAKSARRRGSPGLHTRHGRHSRHR